MLKYRNVTTTNGPAGSVFAGWKKCRMKHTELGVATNAFLVACFAYKNSDAHEEIRSEYPGYITAKYRSGSGDGYDVAFINGSLATYQEYSRGVLDGLLVAMSPNTTSNEEHCSAWMRFNYGRILGKFIMWGSNPAGNQNAIEIGKLRRAMYRVLIICNHSNIALGLHF